VNVFGAALPAIGVLSSLYVGVLEPCARPQSQLSAVVNFRGTILLFALVDPNLSYLTDTTTSGETSQGQLRFHVAAIGGKPASRNHPRPSRAGARCAHDRSGGALASRVIDRRGLMCWVGFTRPDRPGGRELALSISLALTAIGGVPLFRLSMSPSLLASNRPWPLLASALLLCQISHGENAEPFSFATVVAEARRLAADDYQSPEPLPTVLRDLTYDQYRAIGTAEGGVLWADRDSPFQVELLHPGYLFKRPVRMHLVDVAGSTTTPLAFSDRYFNYDRLVVSEPIIADQVGGYAGFRIRYPLNGGPQDFDEIGSFVGASYFRLLGRDQRYGLSARGLAINSVRDDVGEEFPDFTAYWLVEPKPVDESFELYALLDSPSVAAAYHFRITPGASTSAEIRASLFFRRENPSVGFAPLTSMFWYGENHQERPFFDWRPEVHDSDGLLMHTERGEKIWRPLYNHHAVRQGHFYGRDIRGFGLLQRDREFTHYQDLSNPYWQTPSAWVKPLESWGDGDVRLIELPTNNEAMDNVVAFFEPRDPPRAGEHREIAYTLSWDLQEEEELSLNHVTATRIGEIGAYPDTRRFVIDFDGPTLRDLPSVAPVVAEITSSGNGYVTENQCFKNVISGGWRVAFALDTEDDNVSPVELRCVLRDSESGLPLTETWSYQWSP